VVVAVVAVAAVGQAVVVAAEGQAAAAVGQAVAEPQW
jgi:hypothetical protein